MAYSLCFFLCSVKRVHILGKGRQASKLNYPFFGWRVAEHLGFDLAVPLVWIGVSHSADGGSTQGSRRRKSALRLLWNSSSTRSKGRLRRESRPFLLLLLLLLFFLLAVVLDLFDTVDVVLVIFLTVAVVIPCCSCC